MHCGISHRGRSYMYDQTSSEARTEEMEVYSCRVHILCTKLYHLKMDCAKFKGVSFNPKAQK